MPPHTPANTHGNTWNLQDAKAHFSELVRRARAQGPQTVTCRGKDAVVVVAAQDFRASDATGDDARSLIAFLRDSDLAELDLSRDLDRGRELAP